MGSEEMVNLFAEHLRSKRATQQQQGEWIQVTQGYLPNHRTAIRKPDMRAVVEIDDGVVIYVQKGEGTISTVNCLDAYDEIMSQLGVKPIERKKVKS